MENSHSGILRQAQKCKLWQKLALHPLDVNTYIALVDTCMMWHLSSPTAVERVKSDGSRGVTTLTKFCPCSLLPLSFGLMILMTMLSQSKMMNTSCISRPQSNSIMKQAGLFPMTCNDSLCSSGIKKCLQALIKTQLSEQLNSISQELVYSVGEDCVSLYQLGTPKTT